MRETLQEVFCVLLTAAVLMGLAAFTTLTLWLMTTTN